MFFPDKGKSFREVYRVLAPDGRYFFNVWDEHRYNPFGPIADEMVAKFFPSDPPQFFHVPFSCHSIDPIKHALIDAGFSDIDVAVVKREPKIPDAAALARGEVFGTPLIEEIKARGSDGANKMVEAMTEAFQRAFGLEPGRMPLQAIVFSARKLS
jgi:hypothetical protein